MMEFTPKQIVSELDRYIIGQNEAKKAVAVALRNRYRRNQLDESLREEVTPKNIIMHGPTGVGKTEIARRLAKVVSAPFVKVEATKFTEVGYVGRDVESMVRDLVEVAVRLVKAEKAKEVNLKACESAEKLLLKEIYPLRKNATPDLAEAESKEQILQELRAGQLDNILIEMELPEIQKPMQISPGSAIEFNINDLFGAMSGGKKKKRKVTVKEAYNVLIDTEIDKLIDEESVNAEAIRRAENEGIIFIDEIDKIASKGNSNGPDVSREGVQRDILPIVEGCTVNTKYGNIRTDFILFIAAGAFHISNISDLIPELQGRFPVSVVLNSLTEQDFVQILTEPDNAILMQYTAMLKVDKVNLKFTKEAIEQIANIAVAENNNNENIGARRLQTILEKLLDDISYNAGNLESEVDVLVDKKYVLEHLDKTVKSLNLKKYII
ncbi:MAG: ATP-dependent protease ATPase subunit HslU [Clostridia bacterium]